MNKLNKKVICATLALTLAMVSTPSASLLSNAAGFDPKSVGGTGSNSIPAWKEINDDVIGWFKIPGTNVNWPVVVGKDNLYYNNLGYLKNKDKNGVIWADSDTKFGTKKEISKNTVLYGHNWTNYTANPNITKEDDLMFAQVAAFHHLDFAQKTPYLHYSTENENMTWKVFAAFYTEIGFNYNISDPDDKTFQAILDEARAKSRHDYDVNVNASDKIITLSTCTRTYGSRNDQRFVVMARLMRDGEKIEEVKITENKDFTPPKFK
ncbi:MAG: class B sortase [Oscillospiraceae bacterium]